MSLPLINITRKQALFFAGFLVFYEFLTYIANDMIMPGMLDVVHSFNAPESAVPTSLTAYVLGGASLQIFLGPLSDRFGRRPVMLVGSALFFIFTLAIACSASIEQFLVARFFQGMGLCFIGVIGYTVLQEIFSEMDAVRLIAVIANIAILAPLLGPLAGAVAILYFSWQSIFIIIGMLALVAFIGLWRYMPESVGVVKKDGSIISSVPLAPRVIIKNYGRLLQDPAFLTAAIATGVLSIPCIAWIAISPIIIIAEAHYSVIGYALWQLPMFGACILGNWCLHRLTHSYNLTSIILIGSSLVLLGLFLSALLAYLFSSHHFLYLMPGVTLYGLGLGIASGPLNRYALYSTEVTKGSANAMISLINMGIQGLGVELGKWVYASHDNLQFALFTLISGLIYFWFLKISLHLAGPQKS